MPAAAAAVMPVPTWVIEVDDLSRASARRPRRISASVVAFEALHHEVGHRVLADLEHLDDVRRARVAAVRSSRRKRSTWLGFESEVCDSSLIATAPLSGSWPRRPRPSRRDRGRCRAVAADRLVGEPTAALSAARARAPRGPRAGAPRGERRSGPRARARRRASERGAPRHARGDERRRAGRSGRAPGSRSDRGGEGCRAGRGRCRARARDHEDATSSLHARARRVDGERRGACSCRGR